VGVLLHGVNCAGRGVVYAPRPAFDVGLGVMGLATIIQVVFIGLANRNLAPEVEEVFPAAEVLRPPDGLPAKVVGEIRGPR